MITINEKYKNVETHSSRTGLIIFRFMRPSSSANPTSACRFAPLLTNPWSPLRSQQPEETPAMRLTIDTQYLTLSTSHQLISIHIQADQM